MVTGCCRWTRANNSGPTGGPRRTYHRLFPIWNVRPDLPLDEENKCFPVKTNKILTHTHTSKQMQELTETEEMNSTDSIYALVR
jgi:hypothetical protein